MSWFDAGGWDWKGKVVFFVVLFLFGTVFGFILRDRNVLELQAKIDASDETRVKLGGEELKAEKAAWKLEKEKQEEAIKSDRKALETEGKEQKLLLYRGQQNEEQVQQDTKQVRETSESRLFLANILLFVVLPIVSVLVAGFFWWLWWAGKASATKHFDREREQLNQMRSQHQRDREDAVEADRQRSYRQLQQVDNAQRTLLVQSVTERLRENPEALERSLAMLIAPRSTLEPPPPVPDSPKSTAQPAS